MTLAEVARLLRETVERTKTELRIDDLNAMRRAGYQTGIGESIKAFEADPDFRLRQRLEAELERHREDAQGHRSNAAMALVSDFAGSAIEQSVLAREHKYAVTVIMHLLEPESEGPP